MHLAVELLPADELDPRGHGEHARLPGAALYVLGGQAAHGASPVPVLCAPAGQGAQTCPLRPVKPGLHVQASPAALASVEFEFRGQTEQRDDARAAY